ncbi:bifunctional RNase H/acid phosphatase [Saccharopolyspora gloriosae]|uniref:bifunctional RNase H/acid phosphatase n=1 Tax=Saccharopolyspora gloriosae TaxID=455344 RepID=UPI001FB6A6DA|nr:bifunctional RNase H/acid phosphatase [Saccharopolyspora gloriosae]
MRVVVEADGGSRGNPGPAGCGAVVRGADGAVLAERSRWLGVATNNVAEYEGLLAGLRAAAELGADEVDVRMDSKLVVEQLSGRWKIKHEALRSLAAQAKELVADFSTVTFEWIPRASNADADRLANEAMDTRADAERGAESASAGSAESASAGGAGTAAAETSGRVRPTGWNGAVGAPTKLLLLRHGQTAMSVDRRYSGRGDVPLTELGESQARAAAARLAGMDGVVTADGAAPVLASPLGRTRQTAEAVAAATGGELTFHDGLLETDFGAWEGLTFLEAAEKFPELHRSWLGDSTVEPPEGESLEAVFGRVTGVCDEILERHAGTTVIVVSHVTPIKALLRLGLDVGPSLYYRLHLDLASLSIVEFYPDGNASVRLVNDISHLG